MNGQSQISQQLYNVLPTDIEGFDFLAECPGFALVVESWH